MRHFLKDGLEPFSYLIYVVALLISLHPWNSNKRKVLLFYYATAANLIFLATYKIDVNANRSLYNLLFFLTISSLSFYYRSIFIHKHLKVLVIIIYVVNLLLFIEANLISKNIFSIHNYSYATIYLSIVIFCLLYFWQVLSTIGELNILEQPAFYIAAGHLLYFLSCFFIILFYDNVEEGQRALLWSLQNIILFIGSVITLSGSLWIYYRRKS